jgi:hypothetical protein
MNKKIIWGVVVAVIVIGGVYFFYKNEKETNYGDSEAQLQLLTTDWSICKNVKYGYEVKYPSTWKVWEQGSGTLIPSSCAEDYSLVVLSPGQNQMSFQITVMDKVQLDKGVYKGIQSVDEMISRNPAIVFGNKIPKTGTVDGEKLVWASDIQAYAFHNGSVFMFRSSVDQKTLEQILSTFKFASVPEKIATPDNGGDGSDFLVEKPEWGISFPLPIGWNVTNDVDSQIVLTQHSSGDRITLDYTESQSYTDIDAKRGQVTYTFNDVSGKWIAVENTYTDGGMVSNEAKPVLMINKIIPVFVGSSRWKTYIVPLSHTQFLKINITGSGQTTPLDEFIKTIIITG